MSMIDSLRDKLRHSWGWLMALGITLMLFGAVILTVPFGIVTASLATEIWIAAALVVVGVLELVHGWTSAQWEGRVWQMVGGLLFVIGGIVMFVDPTIGLVSLTVVVGAMLVAQGATGLLVSTSLAEWSGRKWLIITSALSLFAGFLVLFDLPSSAGWTLGTIVGAALLLQGFSLTLLGFDIRREVA